MTGNDPISGKKVFVAGHNGMVGSAIMRKLEPEDCDVVTASHDELDLTCQIRSLKLCDIPHSTTP